jgi:hypothetical protein
MLEGAKPSQVGDVCTAEPRLASPLSSSLTNTDAVKVLQVKGHVYREDKAAFLRSSATTALQITRTRWGSLRDLTTLSGFLAMLRWCVAIEETVRMGPRVDTSPSGDGAHLPSSVAGHLKDKT